MFSFDLKVISHRAFSTVCVLNLFLLFKIIIITEIMLKLVLLFMNVKEKKNNMFSPGIEPGTICVLGRCDNHYTTETNYSRGDFLRD